MSLSDRSSPGFHIKGRRLGQGDRALAGILASDLFEVISTASVNFTMLWWVLSQDVSEIVLTLVLLGLFIPTNIGVLMSGAFVAFVGSRKLLVFSKAVSLIAAALVFVLDGIGALTLINLVAIGAISNAASGPSVSADESRVPALARLARRRIVGFHTANGILGVLGALVGLGIANIAVALSQNSLSLGVGVFFAAASLATTYKMFPRDRIKAVEVGFHTKIWSLTRSVFKTAANKPGLGAALLMATIGILIVDESYTEVVMPLALRALEVPPSALSAGLVISTIGSILGSIIANKIYGMHDLALQTLVLCSAMLAGCVVAVVWNSWITILIAVAIASLAAAAVATMVFTKLQESMPVSLQAQTVSVWQGTILVFSTITIAATGFSNPYGPLVMCGLIFVTFIICLYNPIRRTRRS